MSKSKNYVNFVPTNDTTSINAEFNQDLYGELGNALIMKLKNAEKSGRGIDVLAKMVEVSLETHLKTTVSKSFLSSKSGVSELDLSSVSASFAAQKSFGRNAFGVFFEEALFGGGEANTPYSDVAISKMLTDIDNKIARASATDIIELQKLKIDIENLYKSDYYNILRTEFFPSEGSTRRLGGAGSKTYTFREGGELKATQDNPYFPTIHGGNITVDEPGGRPTDQEAGNQIFKIALQALYEKMNLLLLISYRYERASSTNARKLIYLVALDLFHQLAIDKVIQAFTTKLITVKGQAKYAYEKSTGKWYQTGALGRRTYSYTIDFSNFDRVLENMAADIKERFKNSQGMSRDKLRSTGLYNENKVLFEEPGNIPPSLFNALLGAIDPEKDEWLVNPNG